MYKKTKLDDDLKWRIFEKAHNAMEEYIQKQSISHISAVSETNKLLASWRLAQYFARKEKKTLQVALYRWSRITGAMMMSKGAGKNKVIVDLF